jgi:hypothetical protein
MRTYCTGHPKLESSPPNLCRRTALQRGTTPWRLDARSDATECRRFPLSEQTGHRTRASGAGSSTARAPTAISRFFRVARAPTKSLTQPWRMGGVRLQCRGYSSSASGSRRASVSPPQGSVFGRSRVERGHRPFLTITITRQPYIQTDVLVRTCFLLFSRCYVGFTHESHRIQNRHHDRAPKLEQYSEYVRNANTVDRTVVDARKRL